MQKGLGWLGDLVLTELFSEDACLHAFSCMHFHSAIEYLVFDPKRCPANTSENKNCVLVSLGQQHAYKSAPLN